MDPCPTIISPPTIIVLVLSYHGTDPLDSGEFYRKARVCVRDKALPAIRGGRGGEGGERERQTERFRLWLKDSSMRIISCFVFFSPFHSIILIYAIYQRQDMLI